MCHFQMSLLSSEKNSNQLIVITRNIAIYVQVSNDFRRNTTRSSFFSSFNFSPESNREDEEYSKSIKDSLFNADVRKWATSKFLKAKNIEWKDKEI